MYYKCYFHPKIDGGHMCRGCKLPICEDCRHFELHFCPECMRKRDAVDDLRQLRKATAAKARVTSSTTARLRLAIRQVGPIARRGKLNPSAMDPALLATGQLPGDDSWQHGAMTVDARASSQFKQMMAQRRSSWTYDPDRVMYKGLKERGHAPRTSLAARVFGPTVLPGARQENGWFKPFAMGLAVGLAVVLFVGWSGKAPAKGRAKPVQRGAAITAPAAVDPLEAAAREQRANAAMRQAVFGEALAEADQAARLAATRAATAARTVAHRVAPAIFKAPAPKAVPAVKAATPVQVVKVVYIERPPATAKAAPAPRAAAAHSRRAAWRKRWRQAGRSRVTRTSGGVLVTSW